ncbi:GGDEF domain-containing response regulator [Sulfurimonas marina]|uniref:diguanylate cyclase n=1 Tax=Sulfurimonas marina TaxID=2590551 RepID=A0A7M1AUP3_9BACT|nr:diguanylate cyclase [Sulfurimonas marina]QOP41147.1 diguanylate cyclase [Sulfurimonas marina]
MKKYHLLCVDDDEVNLISLKALLDKVPQFEIHCVRSAQAGLKWLLEHKVDLILLDIMMPEIDGFEMASLIRKRDALSHIPIIYVTARDDDTVVSEAFNKGGNDYISKPIRSEELIARIWMQIGLMTKEQEIRQKLSLIEYMMEMQPSMVIVTDGHKLLKANRPFFECSGYDSEESFNIHYHDISSCFDEHGDSQDSLAQLIEKARESKQASTIMNLKFEHQAEGITVKADAVCMGNDEDILITFTDISEIQEENEMLWHDVLHDSLTGLYNRRRCSEELQHQCAQAKRYGHTFSLLFFDIDNFKDVNDTYGHPKGDEVLRTIANNIISLRQSDLVCRFGGEEFLIILPHTQLKDAISVAQDIRKSIEEDTSHGLKSVTCSFGVVEYQKEDTPATLLEKVDKALYQAKARGKNCVEHLL